MQIKEEDVFDLISIEHQIETLKNELNPLLKMEKQLKKIIQDEMENDKVKLFEIDELKITMVCPKPRKTIDEDLLKQKYPEIYEEVVKEVEVKGNLRITLKKGE